MASSKLAVSMIIQDSGARGCGFEDACLCNVADRHSEGDIKTNVTALPVNPPPSFFSLRISSLPHYHCGKGEGEERALGGEMLTV